MNIQMTSKIKILLCTFVIFTALVGLAYKRIASINPNLVFSEIQEKIQNEFSIKLTAEKSYISLLPKPKVIISRINTDNGIFIDSASIELGLFSLLFGSSSYNNIKISELFLNPKKLGFSSLSYQDSITKLYNSKINSFNLCIGKIRDTAVTNRLLTENLCLSKGKNDMEISSLFENKFHFVDKVHYLENGTFTSNINVYNDNFKLQLNTQYSLSGTDGGDFLGKIQNLKTFSQEVSPILNFMINDNIKTTENIIFSGKISKQEDSLTIENIELKGENIDMNGTYWFAKEEIDTGTLALKINKINFDSLFSNGLFTNYQETSLLNLHESKLRFAIESDKVAFSEDVIHDFKIDATGDGNKFKIAICSGRIESGGDFQIAGELESNKYRPKFLGNIIVNHININHLVGKSKLNLLGGDGSINSNLYLKSDIIATPIDFKMQNFTVILGSETLLGNINIKLAGNEKQIISDIDIDDLNIQTSTFPLVRKLYDYVTSLTQDMNDANYTLKYLALRTFPIKTILDINFDGLSSGENKIMDRMNLLLTYDSGQLKIDDFLLSKKDNFYLQGNGRIFANSLLPQLKFNISNGFIKLKESSKENINNIIDFTTNNIDLAKLDVASEGSLESLEYDKIKLSDLSWTSKNDGKILNVPSLKFNIDSGNVDATGSLAVNPLKASFTFGAERIDLPKIISSFIKKPLPIASGFASINGQFSSTATNLDDLLYNLYLRGDFLSKNLRIENIDIDGLILKLSTLQLEQLIVDRILSDSASSGSTDFNEISGSYDLNNGILSIKNISMLANSFSGSAGIAINIYDQSLDLNSIFSFYPLNSKIISPKNTPPIKVNFAAKGDLFDPDKLLTFISKDDIQRLIKLTGPQNNGNN